MDDSNWVWIIVLILQAIVCAALSSTIAKNKGHSGDTWGMVGFFFGIFGLIAAAGLSDKKVAQSEVGSSLKTCPDCAESVKRRAKVCRFCGYHFSDSDTKQDQIETLESGSTQEKLEVLDSISATGDKSLMPHVMKVFRASRYQLDVQAKAGEVLERLLDKRMTQDLIKIIEKSHQESKVRTAVRLLGLLKDESSMPALISLLEWDFFEEEVTTAVLAIGSPAAAYLEANLNKGKRRQRRAIKRILEQLKATE